MATAILLKKQIQYRISHGIGICSWYHLKGSRKRIHIYTLFYILDGIMITLGHISNNLLVGMKLSWVLKL